MTWCTDLAEFVVSQVEHFELGEAVEGGRQGLDEVLVERQLLQVAQVSDLVGQRSQLVAVQVKLAQLRQL